MEGILFPHGVPEGLEGLEQYCARGGYKALAKSVKAPPEEVIKVVSDAGLRGRGGAGFPTGKKWQFTREAPEEPRYLVLNGGEDEPGSKKDRVLLENLPHLVLEGHDPCRLCDRRIQEPTFTSMRDTILPSKVSTTRSLRQKAPVTGAVTFSAAISASTLKSYLRRTTTWPARTPPYSKLSKARNHGRVKSHPFPLRSGYSANRRR